jgi:hypothetical protein
MLKEPRSFARMSLDVLPRTIMSAGSKRGINASWIGAKRELSKSASLILDDYNIANDGSLMTTAGHCSLRYQIV